MMLVQHQLTHSDKQKLGRPGLLAAYVTPETLNLKMTAGARLPELCLHSLAARTAEEEAVTP